MNQHSRAVARWLPRSPQARRQARRLGAAHVARLPERRSRDHYLKYYSYCNLFTSIKYYLLTIILYLQLLYVYTVV